MISCLFVFWHRNCILDKVSGPIWALLRKSVQHRYGGSLKPHPNLSWKGKICWAFGVMNKVTRRDSHQLLIPLILCPALRADVLFSLHIVDVDTQLAQKGSDVDASQSCKR